MFAHLAKPRPPRRGVTLAAGVCLAIALWLAAPPPAHAARPPAAPRLFASSALSKFFSGFSNRTRVIQLCIVTMVVALVIMMKKLADVGPGPRERRRDPNDHPGQDPTA